MRNVVVKMNNNHDIFCEIDGQKFVNISKVYSIKDSFDICIRTSNNTYISVADDAVFTMSNNSVMPLLEYYYNEIGAGIKTYAGPIIGVDEKYLSNNLKNALIRIMSIAITNGKQLSVYGGKVHQCPELNQIFVNYDYLKSLQSNNIKWLGAELLRKQKDLDRNSAKYWQKKSKEISDKQC